MAGDAGRRRDSDRRGGALDDLVHLDSACAPSLGGTRACVGREAQLCKQLADAKAYCEAPAARPRSASHRPARICGATELHILDADLVTAFTLPGGAVMMTRGLLKEGSKCLARRGRGRFCPRLEHAARGTSAIQVVRTSLLTAAWQGVSRRATCPSSSTRRRRWTSRQVMRYSRDAEREAEWRAPAARRGADLAGRAAAVLRPHEGEDGQGAGVAVESPDERGARRRRGAGRGGERADGGDVGGGLEGVAGGVRGHAALACARGDCCTFQPWARVRGRWRSSLGWGSSRGVGRPRPVTTSR